MENSVFWALISIYIFGNLHTHIHWHSHKLYCECTLFFSFAIRSTCITIGSASLSLFVILFCFVFTSFHCHSSPFRRHWIWVANHRNSVEWWWFVSATRDPTSGYIYQNYTPWTDHINTIVHWICIVSTIWSRQQGTINVSF